MDSVTNFSQWGLVGVLLGDNTVEYGWKGEVLINARNSFGGYTGAQPWYYLIRDGTLIAFAPR